MYGAGAFRVNIELKGNPQTLEMVDELHAGLRTGGGFIDKCSALAYALDKRNGGKPKIRPAFIVEAIRRCNVEFRTPGFTGKSKHLVCKQCYGNDFDAFLVGELVRGHKGAASPCAALALEGQEPYKTAIEAQCLRLKFIHQVYRSVNPGFVQVL